MPIQINKKWYREDELTFIANYQNMEDQHCYYHYRETLFLAGDGTYILKCQGNPGSRYHKIKHGIPVRSQYFKHEPHPGLWLMHHGHQRLAGIMFPDLRQSIESELLSRYVYTESKDANSIYELMLTPISDIKKKKAFDELLSICQEANHMVGQNNYFWLEPELCGHEMMPGFEHYDGDEPDYFDRVKCNTFTDNYNIICAHIDSHIVVPKEYYSSSGKLFDYYLELKKEESEGSYL